MNQIKSIKLGVIAICIAAVSLSSAQTPRTRMSGSNQIGAPAAAVRAPVGSIGNSIRATPIGINAGSATNTGATTNIGAHTAPNAGMRTGISNQAIGITGAATRNGVLSGNSTRATQTGINAGGALNTGATTNIGAHAATNAGAQMGISNQAIRINRAATGNAVLSGNSTGVHRPE